MHLTTTRIVLSAGTAPFTLDLCGFQPWAQDYTVGANARTFAMGGAGIALAHYSGSSGRANPASLAFERKGTAPTTPTLAYRADGPASSNIGSAFLLGGAKPADSIAIAARFGNENATYGVDAYTRRFAWGTSRFRRAASVSRTSCLMPAWSNWVENGQRYYNTLPANAKVDFYNAGYLTLPGVAYGGALPGHLAGVVARGGDWRSRQRDRRSSTAIFRSPRASIPATNAPILDAGLAPEMEGRSSLKSAGSGRGFGRPDRA